MILKYLSHVQYLLSTLIPPMFPYTHTTGGQFSTVTQKQGLSPPPCDLCLECPPIKRDWCVCS